MTSSRSCSAVVTSYSRWRAGLLCLLLLAPRGRASFTSEPRWGQAVALMNNQLFVHGGKTDQFNAYSYTGAQTSNDLFALDLSASFDPTSPPWTYISGSQDASTPQGPTLAWHTLSAYNTSRFLLFGGDGGPNSPIVLPSQNDSSVLLDTSEFSKPDWTFEATSWDNQPTRRIHHTVSTSAGKVYLVGGEKDDGSGLGYSDHYVFDPTESTFTQLPTDNGPPDIFGHASVLLSDGRLLVFGGFTQSSNELIPLTTIWSLDTRASPLSWTNVQVSNDNIPPARRAFASTWVLGDGVLIHGGADAELQTSMSDGWILNTSTNPMTWTNVSSLSDLGPRRDHFATQVGSQVLFGFGYMQNSGAPTALSVFDLNQNTFVSSFTPQSSPSQTTLASPSGTSSSTGSGSSGSGGSNSGSGPQQTGGSNAPGSDGSSEDGRKGSHAVAITVGTLLGVLALAAATVVIVIVVRRQTRPQQFRLLSEDEADSPPSSYRRGPPGPGWNIVWLGFGKGEKGRTLGQEQNRSFFNLGRKAQSNQRRIDMLAHEDSSGFFTANVRRMGSGSSKSWYSIREASHGRFASSGSRPSLGQVLSGSLHSLRNVGAAVGSTIGIRRVTTDGSGQSRLGRDWYDDKLPLDPFTDNADTEGPGRSDWIDYETPTSSSFAIPLASRPRGGRQETSGSSKYSDPFKDQETPQIHFSLPSESGGQDNGNDLLNYYPNNALSSRSTLSHSSQLLPQLETSSKNSSDSAPSSSVNVSSASSKSRDTVGALSSDTSQRPRTLSIINAPSSPIQNVRRSDSWWGRIKRASLRDSMYEHMRQPSMKAEIEFRDPNPPPGRLKAIHEASGSGSSDPATSPVATAPNSDSNTSTLESRHSKRSRSAVYSTPGGHERSTTSLKTSRTADSEALERLGGRVDVAQREATGTSIDYTPSVTSNGDGTFSSMGGSPSRQPSDADRSQDIAETGILVAFAEPATVVESPTEDLKVFTFSPMQIELPLPSASSSTTTASGNSSNARTPTSTLPLDNAKRKRPLSGGAVAARVAEYERRMTLEMASPTSPTKAKFAQTGGQTDDETTKPREAKARKRSTVVKYGLVQRPELFIANPDHKRHSTSSSS